jgi:hypothetical protein
MIVNSAATSRVILGLVVAILIVSVVLIGEQMKWGASQNLRGSFVNPGNGTNITDSTVEPTYMPTLSPLLFPVLYQPSEAPSEQPDPNASPELTMNPSIIPTVVLIPIPTADPSRFPIQTITPSVYPTIDSSAIPPIHPTDSPTEMPVEEPAAVPASNKPTSPSTAPAENTPTGLGPTCCFTAEQFVHSTSMSATFTLGVNTMVAPSSLNIGYDYEQTIGSGSYSSITTTFQNGKPVRSIVDNLGSAAGVLDTAPSERRRVLKTQRVHTQKSSRKAKTKGKEK